MGQDFPTLVTAILRDDRPKVKALLKRDPELVRAVAGPKDRFETSVMHWIYAGDSALHVAAAGYRVEIARMLLAAGAEAGAAGNRRRSQPLHYASDGHLKSPCWDAKRQVAMIRLLLQAGACLNAPDQNGATPLHRAVRTRCAAAVACLLEAGGDATLPNKSGSTPFHLAVQHTGRGGSGGERARIAQREILRTFLDRGVSPALRDGKGKSVLDWARSGWTREMIEAA